jgi:alkylation response protein AidB-like acyl-CoA dehydrogenase
MTSQASSARDRIGGPHHAVYDEEHAQFRDTVAKFVETSVRPFDERWERAGIVDRSLYTDAGAQGLIGFEVPETYGGAGVRDFRFNAVIGGEFGYAGLTAAASCLSLHNDVVLPYFLGGNAEQRARWLPGIGTGATVTAIAMTEPGTGSDLAGIATRAHRDGEHYVLNGSKTFITSGQNADLVIVVARTDPHPHRGLTLLVVERGMPGFERGRNLAKIGQHAQDPSRSTRPPPHWARWTGRWTTSPSAPRSAGRSAASRTAGSPSPSWPPSCSPRSSTGACSCTAATAT